MGTVGFANVTIAKSSVPNTTPSAIQIFVDGAQITSATGSSNSTHFFVYFTFTFHSPSDAYVLFPLTPSSVPTFPGASATFLLGVVVIAVGQLGLYLRRRR